MRTRSLLLALLGVLSVGACTPSQNEETQELYESSTSFDAGDVRPFLLRVSGLIDSGFGETEVEQVMDAIGSLALEEEKELSFQIVHSGSAAQLRLTALADDIEVTDVAFFSPKALADAIDSEMALFFEELGT